MLDKNIVFTHVSYNRRPHHCAMLTRDFLDYGSFGVQRELVSCRDRLESVFNICDRLTCK